MSLSETKNADFSFAGFLIDMLMLKIMPGEEIPLIPGIQSPGKLAS